MQSEGNGDAANHGVAFVGAGKGARAVFGAPADPVRGHANPVEQIPVEPQRGGIALATQRAGIGDLVVASGNFDRAPAAIGYGPQYTRLGPNAAARDIGRLLSGQIDTGADRSGAHADMPAARTVARPHIALAIFAEHPETLVDAPQFKAKGLPMIGIEQTGCLDGDEFVETAADAGRERDACDSARKIFAIPPGPQMDDSLTVAPRIPVDPTGQGRAVAHATIGAGFVAVELNGLMVEDADSVYALRQQQLTLGAQLQAALVNVAQATTQMRNALSDIEAYTVEKAASASDEAQTLANAGRTLLILVTLGVIVVLAIFGWRTLVRVLGPLVAMRRQMENISGAAGENADLSMRLALERNDEVGQAAQAFNRMMDTFEGMVARIRESAEAIAASSRQIAAGNENLSQRTDQQAASLAETASSLEQITATVKQTADYADQAKGVSGSVDERARSAGDVAKRTTAAMSDIRQASEKITSIIKAIDDIAFQTNLLALNASVEAARAGEQGRGFAVVAQEVRKLAGRSAEEAAQIRHLVDDSVKKVSEGEQLVNASSHHLQEIIDSLSEVTRYVTEIAGATKEQSAGIDQINQAISQLDQVTHQNARLVQEASTASQTLDDRAGDMHTLVSRFQVSHSPGQHQAALPAKQDTARLT